MNISRVRPSAAKDVLIIEDDSNVCSILMSYCQNLGVFRNIIVAKDGAAAAKQLQNQKFFLILLDLNIPKRSGQDLLKDFEEGSLNSIDDVLIVSGGLHAKNIPELVNIGIENFLIKPFSEKRFKNKALFVMDKPSDNELAS